MFKTTDWFLWLYQNHGSRQGLIEFLSDRNRMEISSKLQHGSHAHLLMGQPEPDNALTYVLRLPQLHHSTEVLIATEVIVLLYPIQNLVP